MNSSMFSHEFLTILVVHLNGSVSQEHAIRQYWFHISMSGWYVMDMTICGCKSLGSRAIRHQVIGQSGISKHVRA